MLSIFLPMDIVFPTIDHSVSKVFAMESSTSASVFMLKDISFSPPSIQSPTDQPWFLWLMFATSMARNSEALAIMSNFNLPSTV